MSTEIKDSTPTDGPHTLDGSNDRWVSFIAQDRGTRVWAEMPTPDFVAAVETELNGIFISRDELPEVISGKYGSELAVLDSNGEKFTMAVKSDTSERLREIGLAFLAMASYREKNPPVTIDQKQVDALVELLDQANVGVGFNDAAARSLIATGKVTVSTD